MPNNLPPNLNDVVLSALDFLAHQTLTAFSHDLPAHTLVVGSGNALPTGRVLFGGRNYAFRDEGRYRQLFLPFIHPSKEVMLPGECIHDAGRQHV